MIAQLALYRVVSNVELEEAGITRGAIKNRLAAGRLYVLHPGVYAVGHPEVSLRGRWRAAVLACGPGAVLSHRDAAELHGFYSSLRRPVDVTAPGRSRHKSALITVHRPRTLHPEDVTRAEHIPVTTVARTLLDLAEVLRPHQLRRAWNECQRLGLLDLRMLNATIGRGHGRRGLKPLRLLVAEHRDVPATKEQFQERFDEEVVRAFNLKRPQYGVPLLGYEVDALYGDEKIAIELDSFEFHGKTRAAHDRDRVKQLDLQLAGYQVVRLTWTMLNNPVKVAEDIQNLLSARQVASVAPT